MAFARSMAAVLAVLAIAGCGGDADPASQDALADESARAAAAQGTSVSWTEGGVSVYAGADAQVQLARTVDERIQSGNGSEHFFRAVKEAGGVDAFNRLLAEGQHGRVKALLASHGIPYELRTPGADCAPFLPVTDRGQVLTVGSHTVFIDAFGRPGYATVSAGPAATVAPGVRLECEATAGPRGQDGDVGGHLIPVALQGWGGRANGIPQNGEMSNGPWRIIESTPDDCRLARTIAYTVTPLYANAAEVRPLKFDAKLSVQSPDGMPEILLKDFPNTAPNDGLYRIARAFKAMAQLACST